MLPGEEVGMERSVKDEERNNFFHPFKLSYPTTRTHYTFISSTLQLGCRLHFKGF